MGITYRALDVNLGSTVALKVISARYSGQPAARERFRREARAAAQLRHPNVASVFHFGETASDECFDAMELIEGETLETRVHRDGPLPVPVALEIATHVAQALRAAEAHKLVHRDLKPSNLMIVADEPGGADSVVVKMIDFGLAKAVAARQSESDLHGGFSGTPDFASPEQFNPARRSLDSRSDIYSLGATLWFLLCGRVPFAGRATAELSRPIPVEQLVRAKIPRPVIALLRSMLAFDPAARPQSASELLVALRRCCRAGVAASRRRGMLAGAVLALGLLILGGIALTNHFGNGSSPGFAAAVPEQSIAVLPFENRSAAKEDAFVADGVQDDVLMSLVKVKNLKVIGRSSVMSYRNPGKRNLREIGRELSVAHVLEGSVRRLEDRASFTPISPILATFSNTAGILNTASGGSDHRYPK